MTPLQKKIMDASQKYYTDGTSPISDEEFDKLLEEEKKENPDSPLLDTGHGYDVNLDTTPGEKVKHKYGIIGSLGKCHNVKEIPTSMRTDMNPPIGSPMIASLKLDGLSVVLYYKNGKFYQALTRGKDGIGIDITDKARTVLTKQQGFPDFSSGFPFTGAVRGEILMSYANFEEFRKNHPDAENPRNTTAGLINGKEITEDYKYINIVVYTVIGCENEEAERFDYNNIFKLLEDNFKYTAPKENFQCHTTLNDEEFIKYMDELKQKWYGIYPADGIVISEVNLKKNLPSIEYIAIAYKFPSEVKDTKVLDIEWNLSKTGYMIPRINFEPLQLAGTTVKWCAGHNAKFISENKIGPGAIIKITKANEIIPHLEEVIDSAEYELPSVCPSCGKPLEWNGVHLQCTNRECKNSDIQDTLIWFDNIAPVEGLGDTLKLKFLAQMFGEDHISIDNIYNHGEITYNSDLKKEQLFNNTFNKLFTNKVKLADAIKALNIPRFGSVTSEKLAKYPDEVKALVADTDTDISNLSDIGDANFEVLKENKEKFIKLRHISPNIIWKDESSVEAKGDVCITGKLSRKRAIIEQELKSHGYNPVGAVKKTTLFLITDDPDGNSSKNQAANKFGTQKISESEFYEKYMKD